MFSRSLVLASQLPLTSVLLSTALVLGVSQSSAPTTSCEGSDSSHPDNPLQSRVKEGLTTKKAYFYHPDKTKMAVEVERKMSKAAFVSRPTNSASTMSTMSTSASSSASGEPPKKTNLVPFPLPVPSVVPRDMSVTSIYCIPHSQKLAADICSLLGLPLSPLSLGKFADGETTVQIPDSVRGKDAYVICSTVSNDHIVELLLTISALRRASAKSITAVIPYYAYSRQDQKKSSTARVPIAAADVAIMLDSMGVDKLMCMDLHNDGLRGFFDIKDTIDHLQPGPVAAAYFNEELNPAGLPKGSVTVVASHEGQVGRAAAFRHSLQELSGVDITLTFVSKQRPVGSGEPMTKYWPMLVGDVEGKTCIVVDDIVDTGETMNTVINMLKEKGAKEVYAYATHGLFSPGKATLDKIQNNDGLKYLLVTNTVNMMGRKNGQPLPEKVRMLSVAPLIAEAIGRSIDNRSVTGILTLKKGDQDIERDRRLEKEIRNNNSDEQDEEDDESALDGAGENIYGRRDDDERENAK